MNSVTIYNYPREINSSFNVNHIKQFLFKTAAFFLYLIVFAIYWLSVIGTLHGIYNILRTRDLSKEEATEAIGKNRYEAIAQVAEKIYVKPSKTNSFEIAVCEIRDLALQTPKKGYHQYSMMLHRKIEAALQLTGYEAAKNESDNPYVRFIHFALDAILNQVEGKEALQLFGDKILKKYEQVHGKNVSVAKALDFAVYENFKGRRYDRLAHRIFWGLAHPFRVFEKILLSEGVDYNPCSRGNTFYQSRNLHLGGVVVHTSLGPTIAAGVRLEANLRHIKNEKDGIRFEHTLEFLPRKGEGERRKKLLAVQHKHPQQMKLTGGCLDGKIWKGKGNFKEIATSEDFHAELMDLLLIDDDRGRRPYTQMHPNAKMDCGFYFPNLNYGEVMTTLVSSKNAFETLEKTTHYQKLMDLGAKGRKRYVRAMDLSVNVALFLKSLLKEAQEMSERPKGNLKIRLHQACKGCIDRGAIVNVVSALYEDLILGNKIIDEKYLKEVTAESIGVIMLRALKSNNRAIIKERYEALSDLLHLIEEKPDDFFQTLRERAFAKEILYFQDKGGIYRK